MYIEYVLIENFIINYFILVCTSLLVKEKIKCCWLISLLGSGIALILPLFNLALWTSLLIKIFSGALLISLAFKLKDIKRFMLIYGVFIIFTFVFGGGVFAVQELLGQVSMLIIISNCFVVYLTLIGLIKFINRRRVIDNFRVKVRIIDGEKSVEESGYLDSGNLLYDPISSKPIVLITHEVFSKLYGGDFISMFLKKIDEKKLKNGHYISVNSAVKGGKMLVFMVDKIFIGEDNCEFDNVFLGLSFSGFDKAMHSGVLLHSSQVEGL